MVKKMYSAEGGSIASGKFVKHEMNRMVGANLAVACAAVSMSRNARWSTTWK
jgi:hypothetical protein